MPPKRTKPVSPAWAWARYEPDADRPWDLRLAGHLYRRAGFGAGWDDLQRAVADGPQKAVDRLVRPQGDCEQFNRTFDGYEDAAIDPSGGSLETLREWWLRRMLDTPHPLQEKMTLFWHGYFGVSGAKVASARLMQAHVGLLRRNALGNVGPLLEGISRDPAVLLAYNGDANRRARPAEGFARRLVEQFGFGPDEYTEVDIREMARAFTGWFVVKYRLRYYEREHDSGVKRILGQEGRWKEGDVVRIVLQKEAMPRLVVHKLYRWLISETDEPSDELLAPLVASYAKDHDTGRLVETVLRSNLFFSPAAYRRRIKSPVEFALGIVKGLEAVVPTQRLGHDLADLGQSLGSPPTTQGWEGGQAWINSFTLVTRNNLALALLSGADPYGDKLDPLGTAKKHGKTAPDAAAGFLIDLYLQGDLDPAIREGLLKTLGGPDGGSDAARLRRFAHLVVTLPEFQLA